MSNADLSLEQRSGLPKELRFLADRYPRALWTGHANFGGLTAFWLDRHGMFREVQQRMEQEAEAFLDGNVDPMVFGGRLQRLAGFFINQLHGHHQIEDAHYFPVLAAREPKLARAFELLDADHHALDAHLNDLTGRTNAVLQALAAGQPAPVGAFHEVTQDFARFLERHLSDEEEVVVPVILEHGEPPM
ncbi:hemerythrin domain-containing protein [Oceanibium sediminis]|uniref:hemerythrin domain-containing protein n=1 Tax=Oceanibium sediminis TaxID=2026339 RepID=UPI000DD39DE7|nr:hemerythrin domain-containing protein [Oceanibium sediminis]